MIGKDCIETTAAQVTAELLRLCFRPDERVSIITEPVEASPGSSPNLRTAGVSRTGTSSGHMKRRSR
jgi:hypothetical protein